MRHFHHLCHSWYSRPAYASGCADNSSYYETRKHRGAQFGVRRPLRYLSYQLDLSENQMRRMSSVLNAIKNEREQSALDEKRTVTAIADLMADGTPTLEEFSEALQPRTSNAEQLQAEIARGLAQISNILDEDQREQFVGLLLSGAISF